MQIISRVIFNTIILYAKILITTIISLVSVPMILSALGKSDYGLFNLIAGVIAMLAFLNASMTVSTQRFLSVAIGSKDNNKLNTIYNVGLLLHIIIGGILIIIFEICSLFLFNGFLNIEPSKISTAKIIYQFLIVSTFFTIITVPFDAILNAKENMLVFSIIGIIDAVLKLLLAFYLLHCPFNRLIFYALFSCIITSSSLLIKYIYVKRKYNEFCIDIPRYYNKNILKEMTGFTGWNTFGSVAMIGRNQGTAIIINQFFGTIANAAYGIANQINSVLIYFSSTFQKAINPQLMQSEGMNDRSRLIRISFLSSKFSVLVLAIFAIPLIIEMPYVLKLWLRDDIPPSTLQLAQLILILSIIYQYSSGVMSAIQSVGKIKNYFLVMSMIILLVLPVSYISLNMGAPLYSVVVVFIVQELITLGVRLLFAKRLVNMEVFKYFKEVIIPTIITILPATACATLIHYSLKESIIRLFLLCFVYVITYLFFAYFFAIDNRLREYISNFINSLYVKVFKNKI